MAVANASSSSRAGRPRCNFCRVADRFRTKVIDRWRAVHDTARTLSELRDHQLTVRIPMRIRKHLNARAKSEKCSLADVVNHLLLERFPAAKK